MTDEPQAQHVRDIRVLLEDVAGRLAPLIDGLSDADIENWFQRECRARKKAQQDNMAAPPDHMASQSSTYARAAIASLFAEKLFSVKIMREGEARQVLL